MVDACTSRYNCRQVNIFPVFCNPRNLYKVNFSYSLIISCQSFSAVFERGMQKGLLMMPEFGKDATDKSKAFGTLTDLLKAFDCLLSFVNSSIMCLWP